MQWGVYPLLDEDLDDDGLDLIEHARATGVLHSGELGSGVQSTGPWYNPAREQREMAEAHERWREARQELDKVRHRLYLEDMKRRLVFNAEVETNWNEAQRRREWDLHSELAHRYAETLWLG